tara:strand:- start:137 stop:511 length:375 start_codon:yes stop_codon:yes gene_type:complete
MTMKTYCLYVFTQEGCQPCERLKEHVATLPKPQQEELHFVPFYVQRKQQPYAKGSRTALAEQFEVMQTPTLLVVHEEVSCNLDNDGEEWCDGIEVPVERFVGATSIIEHLPATLSAYTYSVNDD